MALTLSSSDQQFESVLRKIDNDGAISPVEFQEIRNLSDKHVLNATGLETSNPEMALGTSVVQFLFAADALVECMQRVAIEARKKKLDQTRRDELKAAIERQIGYVVAGYKSSIERL